MQPVQIIGLIILVLSGIIALAVRFGQWYERQMRAAEYREWQRQWYEEITPKIESSTSDWPAAGLATKHFFDTNSFPRYNPDADTAVFMERQNAETQAFLERLHEH